MHARTARTRDREVGERVVSTLAPNAAFGNTARAPVEVGIEPLLHAVPVVHGTVPEVGSQVDWACANEPHWNTATAASAAIP